MKVAFHFNADHPTLNGYYGWPLEQEVFQLLISRPLIASSISSKIFVGDLLFLIRSSDESGKFDKDKHELIRNQWLYPEYPIWLSVSREILERAADEQNIYAICFESIEFSLARYIDETLKVKVPAYLGAIQVDESSPAHWILYASSLIPSYRLVGKNAYLFWDGFSEETKHEANALAVQDLGYKVGFESLNGRYSIFDKFDSFETARRVAEWKRHSGDMLAFITDHVTHEIGDLAPELGERLWSTFTTFENAETNEQLSQVALSCRRTLEYVIDQLEPPQRKSETSEYKERLERYIRKQQGENLQDESVKVNVGNIIEQAESIRRLANKGVHSGFEPNVARSCLLRTILLLDDIASIRTSPINIASQLDISIAEITKWL